MVEVLENAAIRRQVLPITVDEYHALGESGIISERVELLKGALVEKMSKSSLHVWLSERIAAMYRSMLAPSYCVREGKPLTLKDSEPEPDIAVVEGDRNDFRISHPQSALLVVEVAISSEEIDREKAFIYAEAGIPEYWLILPETQSVEVFTNPVDGCYAVRETFKGDQVLTSSELRPIKIKVSDLFFVS